MQTLAANPYITRNQVCRYLARAARSRQDVLRSGDRFVRGIAVGGVRDNLWFAKETRQNLAEKGWRLP